MTKSELRTYVAAYKQMFEGWKARAGEGFFRFSGPFVQQIWFENLRSGAYRPVMTVSLLLLSGGARLHQFLRLENREVLPRDHERKLQSVRNAINTEFRPMISKAFDETEAMQLFVEQASDRIIDSSSLAFLYAYYENLPTAQEMLASVQQLASGKGELLNWERDLVKECSLLSVEIEKGATAVYLLARIEEEMNRFAG